MPKKDIAGIFLRLDSKVKAQLEESAKKSGFKNLNDYIKNRLLNEIENPIVNIDVAIMKEDLARLQEENQQLKANNQALQIAFTNATASKAPMKIFSVRKNKEVALPFSRDEWSELDRISEESGRRKDVMFGWGRLSKRQKEIAYHFMLTGAPDIMCVLYVLGENLGDHGFSKKEINKFLGLVEEAKKDPYYKRLVKTEESK